MPDKTRSRVDLPEPLCPFFLLRSPTQRSKITPTHARTTTTSRAPAITLPPVAWAIMLFFRERELAPKMANSTVRSEIDMWTILPYFFFFTRGYVCCLCFFVFVFLFF